MRRGALMVIAVSGLVVGSVTPAWGRAPSAAETLCTISDERLVNVTGLVETDSGYAVIQKSNLSNSPQRFTLDTKCQYLKAFGYGTGAREPQDLAITADGTQWIGDTGDDPEGGSPRPTVGLWKVPPNGGTPIIHRLTYPVGDGPHDAHAFLLNGDGAFPIIITKETNGTAGLYVPGRPVQANTQAGVPMEKKGEFKIPKTATPSFLGTAVISPVTGAATAPDGKRVVLRTFSDAFEWDVTNGDVIGAITGATPPRITPLPDEPQGEAIAYTRDGGSFLTVSNVQGDTKLLRYTPTAPAAATPSATGPAATTVPRADSRSWYQKMSLRQFTYLIGAVGILGVLLILIGVLGIRRSRRTRPEKTTPVRVTASVAVGNYLPAANYPPAGTDQAGYGDHDPEGYDNAGRDRGGYGQGVTRQTAYDQGGYGQGQRQGSLGYDDHNQQSDRPRR